MRRELKVIYLRSVPPNVIVVAKHIPMRRELKGMQTQ